ncbi:MAG TPA: biliverdin-producing heme oxygenase [Kofleriaceae bacterium]|nr:biliverdin-producing heme oxygenase [Kofleriaceae bacterium]
MPHTSWMIARLNEETRGRHAEADADFDILFRDDASSTHYMLFLMRVYGFEAPLESSLSMTPTLDLLIDLRERQKAQYLAQDLLALGLRPSEVAEVPQCLFIPQFRGAAEALGWMYVIERSTLAHSVIRRHLLTRLPREMQKASAYLQGYSGVVGTRWREFGAVLDEVAKVPAIADRIVDAAQEAFRTQRRWIEQDQADARQAV